MKAKLPLIVLLILLIGSGFIIFTFYSKNQTLENLVARLDVAKKRLTSENESLSEKYRSTEKKMRSAQERLHSIQGELSRVEREKEDLQSRYGLISQEKEKLTARIKKLKKAFALLPMTAEGRSKDALARKEKMISGDYWADVVRAKAELQATLENLRREILDTKSTVTELQKDNKELSITIDQLKKEKERLDMAISFKERSFSIMSKDMVKEREARMNIARELNQLRKDNIGLKRELILGNKEKMKLQKNLKTVFIKKEELEKKVSEVDTIMREKRTLFADLEDKLIRAVKGADEIASGGSASVELPPIVVKSEGSVRYRVGEILAVNKNDNFVIIGLGEDAGMRPGMRFKVMRGSEMIGIVEIIETRREISAADIKEVYSSYLIQEGDKAILK